MPPTADGDASLRDAFAALLLRACERKGLKIACAESLTGGLLADAFVRIPGASHVLLGSAVTYDIRAKASILGVDGDLLEREGAVHPEVARQMAIGTARLYAQPEYGDTVIGLATTGVAGPGPDGDKPAGLVYVGVSLPTAAMPSDRPEPSDGVMGNDVVRLDGCTPDGRRTVAIELRLEGDREQVREATVLHVLRNVSQLTGLSQE
ncbi:CinA family protein [Bifidobacterium saguinibicoloris]|uniref:CinA family protein n=1 Tax=Bifidobacterium saguinibicoloris TaxID=2834433 RepID=UPI001C586CCF|nr:nicotinamide-nucleotide amidohydrolase family protein [Bifidobacterium saguinibicoloris]MBW3080555.1 nicotinamide-nucleotide amidohydrolase family protein [Bifidobacterium saguinibicoloris]